MARVRPGLCSVSFRGRTVDEIVALSVDAGLEGIEWGGDVHVVPGDLTTATSLRARCRDAGLATPSYGSYLDAAGAVHEIGPVLDTAEALGANTVRVWAGHGGPHEVDPETRARVVATLTEWVDRAADRRVVLATEFHPGTLTESAASARRLLDDVPGLRTYWQPVGGEPVGQSLAALDAIADRLVHLHVFSWLGDGSRLPLADGHDLWSLVASRLAASDEPGLPSDRFALLEFVRDDDPDALRSDAATLRDLLP